MSTVGLLLLAVALFFILLRLVIMNNLLRNRDVDHAKCIAHVAHYVGNEFAASVLQAAAEDYASPEGQHEVKVIANHYEYRLEGPPLPSIWMNNRADALRREVQS